MERAELARRLGAVAMAAGAARRPAATVIGEAQPARFMPAFARAVAGSGPVFVTDPARAGGPCVALDEPVREGGGEAERGWLMIPSGGTGGGVKFARHDGETLAAAVGGFCAHFGLARVNAVGVLPLHHVSGLMAWMRCALTGGVFLPWNWGDLKEGRRPELATREPWVLSLVPTQLQRLLERPEAVAWLRRFEIVFVGGGPVWPELVEAAARADLPLALSYGMTETAAMVTALRPGEFRAGGRSSGTALPHARVTVTADGVVEVAGAAVCRGYYPEWSGVGAFRTEDLGVLDAEGRLTVLGRRDAIINTGGEKVRPEEVEQALRASGEFADVAVIGVPDAEWGQAVVACYPTGEQLPDFARAAAALTGPRRPKRYVAITDWPRNAQGKLNRAELRVLAAAAGGIPPGEGQGPGGAPPR